MHGIAPTIFEARPSANSDPCIMAIVGAMHASPAVARIELLDPVLAIAGGGSISLSRKL
jgi:hypothetical protein